MRIFVRLSLKCREAKLLRLTSVVEHLQKELLDLQRGKLIEYVEDSIILSSVLIDFRQTWGLRPEQNQQLRPHQVGTFPYPLLLIHV